MMKMVLNTGSTIEEGRLAKGGEKLSEEYKKACGVGFMNPRDYDRLGCPERVKVISSDGKYSVVVYAVCDTGIPEGMIFIPRGPWANMVVNPYTFCTGSPLYKGDVVEVEPTDEEVLSTEELIEKMIMSGGR